MTQREPTLISSTHYCVMGDVTIDESAAIAPGVVLQAASGSRIIIGRGTCLAAGVCVQSRAGVLTISAGVSLGASVLVVGKGTIGVNACVSPGSTLINPSVAADAILPPDTLIGAQSNSTQSNGYSPPQPSSQPVSAQPKTFKNTFVEPGPVGPKPISVSDLSDQSSTFVSPLSTQGDGYSQPQPVSAQPETVKNTFVEPGPIEPKPVSIPDLSDQSSTFVPPSPLNQPFSQPFKQANGSASSTYNGSSTNGVQSGYGSSSLAAPTANNRVYGKSQVTELISALFPNRQPLNDNSSS